MNENLAIALICSSDCLLFSRAFMNGLWIFTGIIAGTLVNILVLYIINLIKKRKIKSNIKFEINFNIKKIEEWEELLDSVQKSSNSENMEDCMAFFDFQKIILWTVRKTISDGTVYNFIDQESIITLQKLSDFCTNFYSKRINDEVDKFISKPDKAGVDKMVKFWKKTLNEHKVGLEQIQTKL